jgi:hypothetical protein
MTKKIDVFEYQKFYYIQELPLSPGQAIEVAARFATSMDYQLQMPSSSLCIDTSRPLITKEFL